MILLLSIFVFCCFLCSSALHGYTVHVIINFVSFLICLSFHCCMHFANISLELSFSVFSSFRQDVSAMMVLLILLCVVLVIMCQLFLGTSIAKFVHVFIVTFVLFLSFLCFALA